MLICSYTSLADDLFQLNGSCRVKCVCWCVCVCVCVERESEKSYIHQMFTYSTKMSVSLQCGANSVNCANSVNYAFKQFICNVK